MIAPDKDIIKIKSAYQTSTVPYLTFSWNNFFSHGIASCRVPVSGKNNSTAKESYIIWRAQCKMETKSPDSKFIENFKTMTRVN